jgi:hypothetical protein
MPDLDGPNWLSPATKKDRIHAKHRAAHIAAQRAKPRKAARPETMARVIQAHFGQTSMSGNKKSRNGSTMGAAWAKHRTAQRKPYRHQRSPNLLRVFDKVGDITETMGPEQKD